MNSSINERKNRFLQRLKYDRKGAYLKSINKVFHFLFVMKLKPKICSNYKYDQQKEEINQKHIRQFMVNRCTEQVCTRQKSKRYNPLHFLRISKTI